MLDIFFVIIIVIACIRGYQKGLIIAVFSIVAFIIGLAAALKLSAVVAVWLGNRSSINERWLPVLSFAAVFFVVVLIVRWGGKLVEKTFKMALLGWVNRLGGMAFYAVLYIIILSIFLFYAEKVHLLEADSFQASQTYPFVKPWGPVVIESFGKVIPIFKDTFAQLETFFGNIGDKIAH